MKQFILTLLCLVTFTMPTMAQSMSDAQIIEFVQKEQSKGTSQAQIVTKLMQKGVSVTKLQQLRKKYASMSKSSMGGSSENAGSTDRTRTANGTSVRGGDRLNAKGGNDDEASFGSDGRGSERSSRSSAEDRALMREALDDFMPDSLGMLEKRIEERLKNKKKVFGRDIFNNTDLTFEPNMNIATPQNYRLGPGDAVYIDVYGGSQKTIEAVVSPEGTVTIEGYGPVYVSGMTVDEANARLRKTLGSRYASSKVQLTVGQTRTIMVNVMGEVRAPGTYTLSAFATVFHALYMAGGISDIGTLRNIKVYRQGRLVSQVDVYDYILNGKLTGNVRLTDNDVIVVGAYDCLVNITGKVKRPMYYEMKKSESMQSLLKYSGGFTGDAYTKSVRVIRKNGKEYSVFNVTEFDLSSFHVSDGDSVSVDSILPRFKNMVELKGAVFRPGMYQLGGEVNSVRTLLEIADGLREDAFTGRGVMHRMKSDRTLQVIPVDIKGILDGTVADLPLQNEDVLFIPSRKDMQQDRKLKIYGEVYYPGTYEYAEGMTVEDFILQAGGLKDGASTKVRVSRKINDAADPASVRLETHEMTLVDGFVIDGNEGFKLQPYDELYVSKNPSYREQAHVTIEGEVMSAGPYNLASHNTRVSDVIRMAGGLTPQAAQNGTYVMRKMTDEERRRRITLLDQTRASWAYSLSNGNAMNTEDKKHFADSLLVEQYLRADEYKVAVNLQSSLSNPGCVDDLVLRDGDRIVVEETRNTVKISGAVPYENAVPYIKGKGIKYYMAQGGARGAKNRRWAYIIYQNGASAMVNEGAKVEPGCEIVLPERTTQSTTIQTASMWVSIGSTLATLGAVIATLLK